METELLLKEIVDACYCVHATLHQGFYESVYQRALIHELALRGIDADMERHIPVYYKGITVGTFKADIIVDSKVIVELKTVADLGLEHELQLVNYLEATGLETGLLVNFGSKQVQIRRKYRIPKS